MREMGRWGVVLDLSRAGSWTVLLGVALPFATRVEWPFPRGVGDLRIDLKGGGEVGRSQREAVSDATSEGRRRS